MERDARQFIQSFLDEEYQVTLAQAQEDLDAEGFQAKVAKLDAFFNQGLKSGVVRLMDPSDPDFEVVKEQVEDNTPRRLFLIRSYQHPEHERLYRAYVGTDRKKGTSYFQTYYFARVGKDFKIVARYSLDRGHTKWDWSAGAKINNPGTFQEIQRLAEPTHENDLKDYKSEEGTIK